VLFSFFKTSDHHKTEVIYRSFFSLPRYKIFLFIEKFYKFFVNSEDHRLETIVKIISKNKPRRILEIGSGTFPIYSFLPEELKITIEYCICEVNPQKADYLRKKYPNLKISVADALGLPYKNDYFDLVFSKGVFHHIDNSDYTVRNKLRINFLAESRRVLKVNEINLLMDFSYDPRRFKDFFWHFLHKLILAEGEHNFSNKKETEHLFRESGYAGIEEGEFETYKGLYYYVIGKKVD